MKSASHRHLILRPVSKRHLCVKPLMANIASDDVKEDYWVITLQDLLFLGKLPAQHEI